MHENKTQGVEHFFFCGNRRGYACYLQQGYRHKGGKIPSILFLFFLLFTFYNLFVLCVYYSFY